MTDGVAANATEAARLSRRSIRGLLPVPPVPESGRCVLRVWRIHIGRLNRATRDLT